MSGGVSPTILHTLEVIRLPRIGKWITKIDGHEFITSGVSVEYRPGEPAMVTVKFRAYEFSQRDATPEEIADKGYSNDWLRS